MPRSSRDRRYWLRMLGWSIASAMAAVVIFSGATWQTPWRRLIEPFLISMVFTLSIVPLAAFTMPRVMPAVRGRVAFPFDWAILVPVMIAIGVTGSFVAIFLLRALGYIRPGHVGDWLAGSFKQSVIMTLIFGIAISAVEALRARLDDATMALRTKERDEAEARRIAAEAQLASLESRVNPHFLFNTLNSIATLVHDDPSAAERMTTQLAALLRSSLQSGAALVPLADELKLVRAYLDIERVRFGGRLRYEVRTESDAEASRIPRLAVQTLVENSVKYAVSPSREGASIRVSAGVANGRLRIDVVDDGPGFDVSTVPAGHGLALVRERLAMTFGELASLAINSKPGQTVVTIDLPC
jgi:two-component system, LytTR family, sensor histidine kinase AlgZ